MDARRGLCHDVGFYADFTQAKGPGPMVAARPPVYMGKTLGLLYGHIGERLGIRDLVFAQGPFIQFYGLILRDRG